MNRLIVTGMAALTLTGAILTLSSLPATAQGNAPFAGGGKADVKDPAAEKLAAEAAKLEKQSKAKPKDAKLKLKVGEAYYKAAFAQEYSKAGLTAKARYRVALKLYRSALVYDPNHKEAALEKKKIEDVYRGMPGGIPK
jgi:hypothetical protein